MKLQEKILKIIVEGANQSEELIKDAVRKRMNSKPYPSHFSFAMGTYFWSNKNGDIVHTFSRCDHINRACEEHLGTYGTMTWRIDRENGELVERTLW